MFNRKIQLNQTYKPVVLPQKSVKIKNIFLFKKHIIKLIASLFRSDLKTMLKNRYIKVQFRRPIINKTIKLINLVNHLF